MAADSLFFYILIPIYLMPSIIAIVRLHQYSVKICLVNIFLGWTIYAWVIALVWSTTTIPRWTVRRPGFRSRFVSYFGPFR